MEHLMDLYGLNANKLPFAFQFPRLPPSASHPMFGKSPADFKKQTTKQGEALGAKLDDFRQMYQKFASGLFEMNPNSVIPPGHPLFSRHQSIETLKAENSKLTKENLELKKQVQNLSKEKSH